MAAADWKSEPALEPAAAALARHLAGELRLPLSALARLGARCAASKDPDFAAAGRAIARECERLDVLVANTIELGIAPEEPLDGAPTDLVDVVEKAVAAHRALVEGLSVRVRVLESTKRAPVRGCLSDWLELFSALFSDLLERVPRRAQVDVRVRCVVGQVRVDAVSTAAAPTPNAERPLLARARAQIAECGGELWEVCDDERGFGLSVPLAAE